MNMFAYTWRWIRRGCKAHKTDGFGYARDSLVRAAPILIVFGLPPEIIFEQLLIPAHLWPLKLILNAGELLLCLWIIGYTVSLTECPHCTEGDHLRLRNGALRELLVELRNISSAHRRGNLHRAEMRRLIPRHERAFIIEGAPIVELRLLETVQLRGRSVQRLFVSVDEPAAFCAALQTAGMNAARSASVVR